MIRRFVVFLEALVVAGASAAAWNAEVSGSAGEVAIQALALVTVLFHLPRRNPLSPFQLLPWLALGATWFAPFFPGLYSPYPPTRFLFVLALAGFWKDFLSPVSKRAGAAIAVSIVVAALLMARSYGLYRNFIYGYDLAHVLNILHNTVDGRFLHSDFAAGSILSHHLYLTLALLAPAVEVIKTPWFPQAAQIAALLASALLVYAAARAKYGVPAAVAGLYTFVLHPAFSGQALHEIDPGVFGTLGACVAIYGWATGRAAHFWVGAVLALLSKEIFGAAGVVVGALMLCGRETRRSGVILAAVSILSIAAFLYLARSGGAGGFDLAVQWKIRFGEGGTGGLISSLGNTLRPNRLGFLLHLFLSNGFVALVSFPLLLPALPEIGFNLISTFPMYKLSGHYFALTLPFLSLATARGIALLSRGDPATSGHIGSYVIASAFAASVLANLTPLSHTGEFYDFGKVSAERAAEIRNVERMLAELPPGDVAVLGGDEILPRLADRRPVTRLPYLDLSHEISRRQWLVVCRSDEPIPKDFRPWRSYGNIRVFENARN